MHPFDGRVVSNFIRQALADEDITIFGDGTQTRSFCYVDDLIDGIVRFVEADDEFIGPVNLGCQAETSIRGLAETIIDLTGSSSPIVYEPLPADDPQQRQPDISLAKRKLSWEPTYELESGLKKTINYFDLQLSRGAVVEHSPTLKAVQ